MTSDAQQNTGFTRRTLLRNGLLVGAGTATVFGASATLAAGARAANGPTPASANPATAPFLQWNWGWCNQCQGMFYIGANADNSGWCPDDHDGEPHAQDVYTSSNYGLWRDAAPGGGYQNNWFWCQLCSGLFYGGANGNTSWGTCPVGGGNGHHNGTASSNYVVYNGTITPSGYQYGWLFCAYCFGMFWGGGGGIPAGGAYRGICPRDGGGDPGTNFPHIAQEGSSVYSINYTGAINYPLP